MVHLILSSTKGNQGLRYFPYSGYLGLTPVKVEGIVRTRLDDDQKLLSAKSLTISIRCYEARVGRVSVLQSNILVDHTQVLWSAPEGQEYAPLGEVEFPFRLTLPARVGGFSTCNFVDYRCSWRVEATINHVPISAIGSRQMRHFELLLTRHDLPPHLPTPETPLPLCNFAYKPRSPKIQFSMNVPTIPIGPQDIIPIPLCISPIDPNVSVRSASATIERRITLSIPESSTPPKSPVGGNANLAIPRSSPSATPYSSSPASSYKESSPIADMLLSSTSLASSSPTITQDTMYSDDVGSSVALVAHERQYSPKPLDTHPLPHNSKVIVNTITNTESSALFIRGSDGLWSKTLTLQWPPPKPNSKWAIGETIRSDLVDIRFFVRVKVAFSTPWGNETVELPERDILVVSTNASERSCALAKCSERQRETPIRSKSKSPRRSRRDRDSVPPPPTVSSSKRESSHSKSSTQTQSYPSIKIKPTSRRPHTSAGPCDTTSHHLSSNTERLFNRPRSDADRELEPEDSVDSFQKRRAARPETSQSDTKLPNHLITSPKMTATPSGSSNSTSISDLSSGGVSTSVSSTLSSSDEVKAWEAELARVEAQSRKSSDLLGFSSRIKRAVNLVRARPGKV